MELHGHRVNSTKPTTLNGYKFPPQRNTQNATISSYTYGRKLI